MFILLLSKTGNGLILTSLQTSKLACHRFMDTGRIYETLALEIKNKCITHDIAVSMSIDIFISVPLLLNPEG